MDPTKDQQSTTIHELSSQPPTRETKVLALGLPRSGTYSMAAALSILGYKDVYHSLNRLEEKQDWKVLDRAADATFPVLPTYTGRPFTRAEWDEVYGPCEAVTDTAALFGPQLVGAYPEAKVVLVKRDYERWFASIDEMVITGLFSPLAAIFTHAVQPLLGLSTVASMRKGLLGFFEARNVKEIRQNARMAYNRHHKQLEETVPTEQLLVYKLGDGWGPLCEFLGRPVPDVEFPRLNEAAELKKKTGKLLKGQLWDAVMVLLPCFGGGK